LRPEHLRVVPPGEGIAASVVLAEHLGDSSILHIRVDGVDELLNAKIGTGHGPVAAGQAVGLVPDPAWALTFDATGRLMS
jgi:multiple sugar transport system ATP-binding protein